MKPICLCFCFIVVCGAAFGQFTRQDTLRGSNGRGRSWWDVQQYHLYVSFDTAAKSIAGNNRVFFKAVNDQVDSFQIDLQGLMMIDSVEIVNTSGGLKHIKPLQTIKEGNAWWIVIPSNFFKKGDEGYMDIRFEGVPRVAINPPWDGGFIWTKDSTGKPWLAVACQGLGASSWWPCKDYQGDEPDKGVTTTFYYPGIEQPDKYGVDYNQFICVSNGRDEGDSLGYVFYPRPRGKQNNWVVTNPINSYSTTFYIGDYVSWKDTIMGEKGKLDLSFYALRYNEQKAREQFKIVKQMLHCYEYWMGPYPFYEDGYKLVEAPYLGMEHQSAVAYGNQYKMGYLGRDRSGTGVGLNFDYIIVHESGHEWFGNNITATDIADNWLHEGFTTYTETLFAECLLGKGKAFEFCRGEWKNIRNDKPVIGAYGVQDDGSSDKYDKGAALVHTIRMIMNDDEKFRQLLRGLNKDFYHKTVTSAEVEAYISKFAGYDFTAIFNQYLRTTKIPQLEYYIKYKKLFYRFTNIVEGFSLPMEAISEDNLKEIVPTGEWQQVKWKRGYDISFSKNFLYTVK